MTPEDHKWMNGNSFFTSQFGHNTMVISASEVREYINKIRDQLLTPEEKKQSGGIDPCILLGEYRDYVEIKIKNGEMPLTFKEWEI